MTGRIDWPLLVSGLLSSFLGGLSVRIFLISLPSLAHGLQADILAITWALISYQLATISFSLVFGRLGDIHGPLKIYAIGYMAFTASSLLCGISQNAAQLIVFRFLQGIGSTMAQSTGRVLVIEAMPEGAEGRASALMTMAFHLGLFLGPPLGGIIIDYIDWRWLFFLLIPIGLTGNALAYAGFKSQRQIRFAQRSTSVDYLGSGMFVFLTVALILTVDQKSAALLSLGPRSLLALGFGATLWRFLIHEQRSPNPIINLDLFKLRSFSYSVIGLLAFSLADGVVGFVLPFYLQDVLRLSASFIGIIFLVPAFLTISLAYIAGRIADGIGPRTPALIGLIACAAACLIGASMKTNTPWVIPTAMLGLTGIGTAFFTSPIQAVILSSAPREHRGFATGVLNTAYGLGNMLGISLGGAVLTVAFRHYSGIPGAAPHVENAPAFVDSINANYLVAAALTLVALFTSLVRGEARLEAIAERKHSQPT